MGSNSALERIRSHTLRKMNIISQIQRLIELLSEDAEFVCNIFDGMHKFFFDFLFRLECFHCRPSGGIFTLL